MKINKNNILLLCGITLAMAGSSTDRLISNFYLGGQVGYGNNNRNFSGLNTASVLTPYNASVLANVSFAGDSHAGRVFVGYQVNQYLSLEGGYTKDSSTTIENAYGVKGSKTGTFDGVVKGSVSMTDRLKLYVKAGETYMKSQSFVAKRATSSASVILNYNAQMVDVLHPTYGIGANFDITKRMSADISWSQIITGSDIPATNFAGLGLAIHF